MSKTVNEEMKTHGEMLFLLPEEIRIDDDILKARPHYGGEQDNTDIEDLARSIESNTQIEPIVVRPAYDGEEEGWYLIAGRRRCEAAVCINASKSSKEEPYRLPAIVKEGVDKDMAFRMALSENLKRKNLNPIQNALVIQELRSRFDWNGKPGTRKVAEFLQVSPAFVTTHEKLMLLDEKLQNRVAKGELSAQAAFEFLNTAPEQREAVEQTARKLQEAEIASDDLSGDFNKLKKKHIKKVLKAKHVRTASRQHGAAISLKPLNRAELLEFWSSTVQSPAYGFTNGSIHTFAKTYVMYAEGKIKMDTLRKHFNVMVEDADRGTPEEKTASVKPAKKARKKK